MLFLQEFLLFWGEILWVFHLETFLRLRLFKYLLTAWVHWLSTLAHLVDVEGPKNWLIVSVFIGWLWLSELEEVCWHHKNWLSIWHRVVSLVGVSRTQLVSSVAQFWRHTLQLGRFVMEKARFLIVVYAIAVKLWYCFAQNRVFVAAGCYRIFFWRELRVLKRLFIVFKDL